MWFKLHQRSSIYQNPQQAVVPCLPVIHSEMVKMNRWLSDNALGAGRSWRARSKTHWWNMNMPPSPYSTCKNFSGRCVCVWIRQMHSTQCHMWNRHKNTKDLHAWPLLLEACQLGPKALYSPEGFIRLHHFACSYCTLSTPLVETKQTLETTMKTPRENKLPLKVIFSLSPLIQLCVSHPKIVALALWSEYVAVECTIHGMIFSLTCLCMFSHSCVRVHQLSLLSWRCRVR